MTGSAKRKGDAAEREVQALVRDLTGYPARRKLGAGRLDDAGDIEGVPNTVIQVANYADLLRAVREKLPALEVQMTNGGCDFGALFVRRRGGNYVVVMTPGMWAALLKGATNGLA